MRHVQRFALVLALLGLVAFATIACNTVEGAGEDIESAGEGIQDASD